MVQQEIGEQQVQMATMRRLSISAGQVRW